MRSRAAVVFCYDDFASLERMLPEILDSNLDRIIFAVETCPDAARLIESIDDPRVTLMYSTRRLGKSAAFNRSLEAINEDIVFLISCDVMFEPSLFDTVDRLTDETHSGAITNVVSETHAGVIGEASRVLWHIRDTELEYYQQLNRPIHGGEFIAVRKQFLEKIPKVVNEDEYICLQAQKSGTMMQYLGSIRVFNSVPKTFRDYLIQRRRVIFGHIEIREHGFTPFTMNFRLREDFREFSRMIFMLLRKYPGDILSLHVTVMLEMISHIFAWRDVRKRRSHFLWKVAESAKL